MSSSNTVRFFPIDSQCKCPLGAVQVNEPCRFTLRFSRPSNPEDVYLCITKESEQTVRYPMHYVSNGCGEFVYETTLQITSRGLYFYYFLVLTHSEEIRIASDDYLNAMLGKGKEWQLTVYDKPYESVDGFNNGVMYQIFPDRFFIGGERLKTKPYNIYRDDWGGVPHYKPNNEGRILNNDFFGGNLKGITKKLAYLKSLNVTSIYLNPIFEARSNHKYDTGSYKRIDPDFGNVDDLKDLIKKAGKKDIKIVLDGVFSHTGDDSIYFNRYGNYDSDGAFRNEQSPYSDWYSFKNNERTEYDCWWGIDILPAVNENNPHYNEYINGEEGVAKYWTDMGIGGWRLDVTDELPDEFLDRFVKTVKRSNPNALVLGEVWEDASNKIAYSKRRRYLKGGQLDSVMNYPFKEDILNYIKTGDGDSLYRTICVLINNYPRHVLNNLMNILGTHDTVRILTELGDSGDVSTRDKRACASLLDPKSAVERLKLATVLQYTLPGFPCVFYGDEAGQEGFEDPFNRRCYNWQEKDAKILRHYKTLGKIRSSFNHILSNGDYEHITNSDGIFAFKRIKNGEYLTVVINNTDKPYKYNQENSAPTEQETIINLLTNKPFNNIVPAHCAVILANEKNTH